MSNGSHYDGDAIRAVFISFCGGYVDYALEFIFGEKYVLDVSGQEFSQIYGYEKAIPNFSRMLTLCKTEIMNEAAKDIADYMNFFEIETDEHVDEFKLIYFVGFKMAEMLKEMGLTTEEKIIQYATVVQLDERLKSVTNKTGRPELKKRMRKVISEGKVGERLGTNGIYLIYKCAYRMLQKK